MSHHEIRPRHVIAVAIAFVAFGAAADAQLSSKASWRQRVSCGPGFTLTAASGVPDGSRHAYRFEGACAFQILKNGTVQESRLFHLKASARWDPATSVFDEQLSIAPTLLNLSSGSRSVSGTVSTRFTCSGDPVVSGGTCSGVQHDNSSSLPELSDSFNAGVPLLAKRATLAQASALSAQQSASATPPPPAPRPAAPKIALKSGSGVPRLTLRLPQQNMVISDKEVVLEALLFEDHAKQYRVSGVQIEWQRRSKPGELVIKDPWRAASILPAARWNATYGRYYVVRVPVPIARFAESSAWRVRVSATDPAEQPSAWVEFTEQPQSPSRP
jgi:hypothetical protein